jgi:hypothetical protein
VFDPKTVKELRKEAGLIGTMCGQAHVGQLSWSDFADVVANEGFQQRLRAAFSAAADDVGDAKAFKAARKAARNAAEAEPFVRKVPRGDVEDRAESAIKEMLGRV